MHCVFTCLYGRKIQRTFGRIHMKYDIGKLCYDVSAHSNWAVITDTSYAFLHTFQAALANICPNKHVLKANGGQDSQFTSPLSVTVLTSLIKRQWTLCIHTYSWHMVACWLRHYVTSREVAGSTPDEVNVFINLPNPSGCTRLGGLLSL
jgi:hypothetical protein